MRRMKALLALALVVLVSGCGWHLRGGGDASLAGGTPVAFEAKNPDSEFARLVRRKLEGSGAELVAADKATGARRLSIIGERREKRELTVNTLGRVSEYELILHIDYLIAAPGVEGQVQTLSASRPYTYDQTRVLAVADEEDFLVTDMRRDLADQLLRRLERAGR